MLEMVHYVPVHVVGSPIRVSSCDLERRDASTVFMADLRTYVRTVWPTAIKSGMVSRVGWACLQGGRHTLCPKERGYSAPKCWGTPFLFQHRLTYNAIWGRGVFFWVNMQLRIAQIARFISDSRVT